MDKYLFSYAAASDPPFKRGLIRLVEKATGQPKLKQMYVHNQRFPRADESFWQAAVRSLALDVRYDAASLAAIPRTGPVVVVANHPYGVLDGIVIAWLISKMRSDFRRADQRRPDAGAGGQGFHSADRLQRDRRGHAHQPRHARRGPGAARSGRRGRGLSGGRAFRPRPTNSACKPAIDARWQPFVSQLIQRSKAVVVPVWFGGQNSRLFQIASHLSLTLRLSLIFHEVRTRIGACLPVVIGAPIPFAAIAGVKDRQALADELRTRVYGLARLAPAVEKPRGPAHKLLRPVRAALKAQRAA